MSFVSALVLVVTCIYAADAYPGGAPAGACSTLTPRHGVDPQTSKVPYAIDLSQFRSNQYTPGQTYTLTLSGKDGEEFEGFFVQSRMVADDTTRVGVFTATASDTRLSSCTPDTDGVTHDNVLHRTSITMEWTAPPNGTGSIRFAYAVVEGYTTFWADERSEILDESGDVATGMFISVLSLLAGVGAALLL